MRQTLIWTGAGAIALVAAWVISQRAGEATGGSSFGFLRASEKSGSAVVTAQQAQTFSITVPAGREASTFPLLTLTASAYEPPGAGTTSFVVSLRGGQTRREAEVGRFTIFPAERFSARDATDQRRYSFNLSRALAEVDVAAGPLEVVVRAEHSGGAASGRLTIDGAEVTQKPHER